MDIAMLRTFFLWCTILNAGLMIISFAVVKLAGDWVYRMHSRWFPMPRETFNAIIYSFLGFYKVLIIVFNLVPCLALVIMG